jgi:hypothetical protein
MHTFAIDDVRVKKARVIDLTEGVYEENYRLRVENAYRFTSRIVTRSSFFASSRL